MSPHKTGEDEDRQNFNSGKSDDSSMEMKVKQQVNKKVQKKSSGYDYEFVDKLDPKYECSVCLLVLRNPTQTKCGHRFCRDCILSCMNGNKQCPIDKQPLTENGLFPDTCIEREILQLKIKCPNVSLGCKTRVDLRYIEDHVQACIYQPVLCSNECSVTVLQKELDDHLCHQCVYRLTQCKSCNETYAYNEEQNHLAECPLVSVSCELCGKEMARGSVAEHRNQSCLFAEVPCNFLEHGCEFKASRNSMKQHSENAVKYHVQLLSTACKKTNTLVLDLARNLGQLASGNFSRQPSLRSQISQSSVTEGRYSPSHPERTLESILVGAVGCQGFSLGNNFNLCPPLDEKQEWDLENEMRASQQSAIKTKKKVEMKNAENDLKPGKCDAETFSSIDQENLLRILSEKCLDLDQRIMREVIRVDRLIKKMEFMENCFRTFLLEINGKFCNGTYVWKIPKFSEARDHMVKTNKIFHSPPFYSSQFGYKFCLRTNVNIVKNETFLTLYIHMMQSENDDFLTWPFQGKITLSILNCKEGPTRQDFVEDMVIMDTMDAFKRPKSERSIKGYGFKEFISLDHILNPTPGYDYLKDDVLCIRAVVMVN